MNNAVAPPVPEALTQAAGVMSIFLLGALILFITWIVTIIDVIRSDFKNPSNKTVWILLLIFMAPLATILYQFMGGNQKR
jgi:hypothetical protein